MPDVLDVFSGDAFSMASLTDAINHADYQPGLLGQLGLYQEDGVPTRTVIIEEEYQTINLVANKPWGGVATPTSVNMRNARSFIIPHLPLTASVTPEEVQNLRSYAAGMTPQQTLMAVNQLRDRKLRHMRANLETTIEYHRIGALRGNVLDSDGVTSIFNLFTEFGVSQQTLNMVLGTSTTNVVGKIRAAIRLSMDALKNSPISGWAALCSDAFFDDLTGHGNVEKFYLSWQAAQSLSGEHRAYGGFNFGGVQWFNYRGSVGGVSFVEADYAYLFPMGVPGMFIGRFGPSDYIDRVNQIPSPDGLPIEVRSEMKPMGKGIDIEAQSNPLYLCTKPRAVIKLHKHNG